MISRRAFTKLGLGTVFAANMTLYRGALAAYLSDPSTMQPDLRRTGKRAHGSYWGTGPEQIDILSGNLNISMPLLTLQSRGLLEPLNYSYNSQIWQVSRVGTQLGPEQLSPDRGYGSGWSLQLGSIRPTVVNGETVGYSFTDTAGTVYRLYAQGNVYRTLAGKPVTWDPVQRRVYFASGKFWQFDSISQDESDTGTAYPTLVQDTNGNQIVLTYLPAMGKSTANTSGRISSIRDARAKGSGSGRATMRFVYDASVLPRLQFISDLAGTESTQVSFSSQRLTSPFSSSAQAESVSGAVLKSVGLVGFGYNEHGELTAAQIGETTYSWEYGAAQSARDGSIRGVTTRVLEAGSAAQPVRFTFDRQFNSGDPSTTAQVVQANELGATRTWNFGRSVASEEFGLLTQLTEKDENGRTSFTRTRSWSLGYGGAPFLSAQSDTVDPDSATAATRRKEFTRDDYGNVVEVRQYPYDSSSQLRIIRKTYITDASYLGAHIYNLLARSEVTDGTSSTLVQHHLFDTTPLIPRSGLQEWTAPAGPRGNITESYVNHSYIRYQRDITGNIASRSKGKTGPAIYVPEEGSNNTRISAVVPSGTEVGGISIAREGDSIKTSSPNGIWKKTTYDSKGRKTRSELSDGEVKTYTYNDNDPTVRTSTSGSRSKTSKRDTLGRVTSLVIGDGSESAIRTQQLAYASVGFLPHGKLQGATLSFADDTPPQTHAFRYNSLGRMVSRKSPGVSGAYTMVHQGNSTTVTTPAGIKKTVTRDVDGNLQKISVPSPTGGGVHTTVYQRNKLGQVTGVQISAPKGTQTRRFAFDTNGKLMKAEQPETGKKTRTYGSDGTLSTVTDAKGQTIRYVRDGLKRTARVLKYDASGKEQKAQNVTFHYDSNPLDTSYSQNTMGRLAAVEWGDASSYPGSFAEMYSYSTSGRVTGQRLRITSGAHSADLDLVMTYNEQGKLSSIVYPQGGPAYSYTYDSLNRIASIVGASGAIVDGVSYTSAGRLAAYRRNPSSDAALTEKRTFTSANRIQRVLVSNKGGSAISDLEYEYDPSFNKIAKETDHAVNASTQYKYDEWGRLTGADNNSWGFNYSYDGFGNQVSKELTKGVGFYRHENFDSETNRSLDGELQYDANGNVTTLPYLQLSYDIQDRLVQARHSENGTERYVYSPNALRVWRERPDGSEEIFCYDGKKQLLATYLLSRSESGELALTLMQANTYFRKSLIATDEESVISDRRGTTRASVSKKGEVRRYQYTPFGDRVAGDAKGSFSSYQRDSTSGLDYAVHRYYSSLLGRFITPDPLQASAQVKRPLSWNRYHFVSNDPVNRQDRLGLSDCAGNPPATPDNSRPHQFVFESATDNSDGSYELTYQDAAGDEMIIGFDADGTANQVETVSGDGSSDVIMDENQFMGEVDSAIAELQQCIASNANAAANYTSWATSLTTFTIPVNTLLFMESGLPAKKAGTIAAAIAAGDKAIITWGAQYMTRSNIGMQNEISNLNNWKNFFNTGGFGCNPNT